MTHQTARLDGWGHGYSISCARCGLAGAIPAGWRQASAQSTPSMTWPTPSCVAADGLKQVTDQHIPLQDRPVPEPRMVSASVKVMTIDGCSETKSRTGVLMGDKTAPQVFKSSCCRSVSRAEQRIGSGRKKPEDIWPEMSMPGSEPAPTMSLSGFAVDLRDAWTLLKG